MTFRSRLYILLEWLFLHRRNLSHAAHDILQKEYHEKFGHYRQTHRSRDYEPFPGWDTQVDVYEEPVDRVARTTRKGYVVRRWVRGKEVQSVRK